MTRCVVCGARPSEECNQKTHQAHHHMWLQAVDIQHQAGTLARHIITTIDRARQTTQTDEHSPSMQSQPLEPKPSRVWQYR